MRALVLAVLLAGCTTLEADGGSAAVIMNVSDCNDDSPTHGADIGTNVARVRKMVHGDVKFAAQVKGKLPPKRCAFCGR